MEFIFRLFIKDKDNVKSALVRSKYGQLSGLVGIILNFILFVIKLIAGIITSSISVMADAFNNLSDAGSSIITLIGFKISGKPADSDHPFGHGRVEYLCSLFVSVLIFIMGYELLKASVTKIIKPVKVETSLLSFVILAVAILVKLWMYLFNRKIAKKISSGAVMATARDSVNDCLATAGVTAGLVLSEFFSINTDGYIGLVIALFVLYSGYTTIKESTEPLLGGCPDRELVENIEKTITAHHEALGIHDLIVHNYGPSKNIISVHVEVDSSCDLNVIHDKIDLMERELAVKYNCVATIHMDPVAVNDERVNKLRKTAEEAVREINEKITIHDFRIVAGPTHTNMIFDAVLPFEFEMTDSKFKELVNEKIKEYDSTLFAVIDIDKAYIK